VRAVLVLRIDPGIPNLHWVGTAPLVQPLWKKLRRRLVRRREHRHTGHMDTLEAIQFYRLMYVVGVAAAAPFFAVACSWMAAAIRREGHPATIAAGFVVCGIMLPVWSTMEILVWAGPAIVWHERSVHCAFYTGLAIGIGLLVFAWFQSRERPSSPAG
jgi:hypothetical protein